MGITKISECELLTYSSGEDPHFPLLGKFDLCITPNQRGLNGEEGRGRREVAVVMGWATWI